MNQETKRTKLSVHDLVQLSVLIAIMLLLELTGLGMIKTAGLEITIMLVPVIVGAIVMGPAAGALLGGVFGLISFWECFGKSAFGVVLMGINPFLTFLVCVPTRILAGWICGLVFQALRKVDKTRLLSFGAAGLSGRAVQHGVLHDHPVPVLLQHRLHSGLCAGHGQRQRLPVRHRLCGCQRSGGGHRVLLHRRRHRQGCGVQQRQAGCPPHRCTERKVR